MTCEEASRPEMTTESNPSDQFELQPGTFGGSLGIVIREASRDRIVAELEVREELKTSWGALHGGAIMTLADTLTANAAFLNLPADATTATIESKANFFAAVREGVVVAETTPLHRGRRTMVWQTRVTNRDGRLLALVIQTQAVIEPSR
jgi:1,4-dihydroxy-2-naphthoyl-CoA hydrolase